VGAAYDFYVIELILGCNNAMPYKEILYVWFKKGQNQIINRGAYDKDYQTIMGIVSISYCGALGKHETLTNCTIGLEISFCQFLFDLTPFSEYFTLSKGLEEL
jgi:hypothetical protein